MDRHDRQTDRQQMDSKSQIQERRPRNGRQADRVFPPCYSTFLTPDLLIAASFMRETQGLKPTSPSYANANPRRHNKTSVYAL